MREEASDEGGQPQQGGLGDVEGTACVGALSAQEGEEEPGDGDLGDLGFATNSDWPGREAKGTIVRGGAWYFDADELRISDGTYMNNEILGRGYLDGIRGARSAPEPSQRSTGRGSP